LICGFVFRHNIWLSRKGLLSGAKGMKVVIVAPFWQQPHHVGVYRIDRFIRWLSVRKVQIILVLAGSSDQAQQMSWGMQIIIRDPLGLYKDIVPGNTVSTPMRRPNRLRRLIANLIFNPDPTVVWARRAAGHPLVVEHGEGADFVLSSNPPESAHVASYLLAKRLHAKLIVDMRDGWLDEPLKPLLQYSSLQRLREGRLENRILREANHIFVTSENWQLLLKQRLPFTGDKTTVLTNAYPPHTMKSCCYESKKTVPKRLTLIHAGRFSGSRNTQRVELLLKPLLCSILDMETKGNIVFIGRLEPSDLNEIACWKPQFELAKWSLEVYPPVSRAEVIKHLHQADGLLLLSASYAAIPSKLFEYLPTGKPILSLTPVDSAVCKLSKNIPQIFSLDYTQPLYDNCTVHGFISACSAGIYNYEIPTDFTEDILSETFYKGFQM